MPERLADGEWRYESAEDFLRSLHQPGKYGGSCWRSLNGISYEMSFYGPREVPSFVIDTCGSESPPRRLWVSPRRDGSWFRTLVECDAALLEYLERVILSWPCESKNPRRTRQNIDGKNRATGYENSLKDVLRAAGAAPSGPRQRALCPANPSLPSNNMPSIFRIERTMTVHCKMPCFSARMDGRPNIWNRSKTPNPGMNARDHGRRGLWMSGPTAFFIRASGNSAAAGFNYSGPPSMRPIGFARSPLKLSTAAFRSAGSSLIR